jgi:hypothetical protein
MPFDQATALTRLPALSVSQTALVQPILDAAMAAYAKIITDLGGELPTVP